MGGEGGVGEWGGGGGGGLPAFSGKVFQQIQRGGGQTDKQTKNRSTHGNCSRVQWKVVLS